MRSLQSFSVRPALPPELSSLERLAMNLRWSWDEPTRDLFRWVDKDAWEAMSHDPVRLLGEVPRDRLDQLAADPGFLRYLQEAADGLDRYLTAPRWFQTRTETLNPARGGSASPLRLVAYFSPEFGISEALPQYSGGLGVLAGDHLKASSDLGVPLVGVGLFYRSGYFSQLLTVDGMQQERFSELDPDALALTRCDGVRVTVDLAGEPLQAQIWRADVGRVRLYLLDSDVDGNTPEGRTVTDRLYGGDTEHRIRQEILLGIGGVRALQALGLEPQVFHTNEGHAGFLGLERVRQLVAQGFSFAEAVETVRAGCVFTTHTPVPAGIDRFPLELMERYFGTFADECGVTMDELMALGHRDDEPEETRFNMAVMGLRLAARRNGVAALHGAVSRAMFAGLWPEVPVDEVPIGSVTNGVHAPTWISPELDDLLTRRVLPEWDGAPASEWARIAEVGDDELWRALQQGRDRLVAFVRGRLRSSRLAQGFSTSDVAWTNGVLDPTVFTVGFARRFATYKRATLLLSQPERLQALLFHPERPVQMVFAGKAHPADQPGKEMIQQIQQFAAQHALRHHFVFLDDYDMAVARALYQGADIWLNTPRRPQEACGTSGMKAALNGSLNCSILDGWWDECFDGQNGWAITSAEDEADLDRRDELEAESVFDLLESQIVPLFYARGAGGVPRGWVERVKDAYASLGPQVTASRMVRDYVQDYYEPAALATDAAVADGGARGRSLADWRRRVVGAWAGVKVAAVEAESGPATLGEDRAVAVTVGLGALAPADVAVQVLHGPVGAADEIQQPEVLTLTHQGTDDAGRARSTGSFRCTRSGRYGFTVRVVPSHPDLATPVELGLVAWA
jgi:starch phosphorylase